MKSDVTWQNYLDEASNAIIADKPLEPVRKLYNMTASEDMEPVRNCGFSFRPERARRGRPRSMVARSGC